MAPGSREARWRSLPLRLPASGWGGGPCPGQWGQPRDVLASRPQEACERSLAEMESSHQQVMEELQRHHERELQRLQQEKEWLLAEETAATASGENPAPHEPPSCGPWLNRGRLSIGEGGSQCQTWENAPGGVGAPRTGLCSYLRKGNQGNKRCPPRPCCPPGL